MQLFQKSVFYIIAYCIAYWTPDQPLRRPFAPPLCFRLCVRSRVPGPDRAKGPGPGPLGPGAGAGTPWARGLGAPGPKMWDMRGDSNHLLWGTLPTFRQATYCQASYLLSGKPSAVMKLATYCQASYVLSGKPSAVMKLAPNFRIHAPKSSRMHAPDFEFFK